MRPAASRHGSFQRVSIVLVALLVAAAAWMYDHRDELEAAFL